MSRNLFLPASLPMGAGQQQQQQLEQSWDTVEHIHNEVRAMGFTDLPSPEYECPELTPDKLTTTDSRSYTETYAHLLGWFNFASEKLSEVQARVLQYENMIDVLTAQTRRTAATIAKNAGTKMTVEERHDNLLLNPEYQEISLKLQKYKQAKILLTAKVDGLERSLRVVSRQVEIRRLDQDTSKVVSNMPSRQPVPSGRFQGGR